MSDSQLLALAERCEAAEGPDRELDAQIAALLCGGSVDVGGRYWKPGVRGFCIAPSYTASLEDAKTLVAQGRVILNIAEDDITTAIVDGTEATANTPALALTAACLRARSAAA